MHINDAIELVTKATRSHLHYLDEQGLCSESDDYVVALSVFEDWLEYIKSEEEKEALREAEWNRDPYDHIEEREADYCLGEQESQIRNDNIHGK